VQVVGVEYSPQSSVDSRANKFIIGAQFESLMQMNTQSPIRILLADSHALVRAGFEKLIASFSGMVVVGEAGTLARTLELAAREQPDVILLEPNLDELDCIEVIPQLLRVARGARILLVTADRDPQTHYRAVQVGAIGVVLKDQSADVLRKAIEKVNAGEAWLDRSTIASVLTKMARPQTDANPESGKIASLSERERDVIRLIGKGLKNKSIADQLSISEKTVQNHLGSIFSKLGIADRLELIIYAYRHGLADIPT